MKKSLKHYLALILTFALVLSVPFAFSTQKASAATGPVKLDKWTYWAGEESWSSAMYDSAKNVSDEEWDSIMENATLVSAKSSNNKVLKLVRDKGEKSLNYGYYLMPKKAGKSKVTIKYKYDGKTYTMSRTYTVKKYPKPIKTIKVNGKAIKLSKNKFSYDKGSYKKTTATVKITPAKGWKIVYAYTNLCNEKTGDEDSVERKASVFTKGKSFKVTKGYDAYTFITLQNKKGETFEYAVRFFRGTI